MSGTCKNVNANKLKTRMNIDCHIYTIFGVYFS